MARSLIRPRVVLPALLLVPLLGLARHSGNGAPWLPSPAGTPLQATAIQVASPPWREAAQAMRRSDFEAARRQLAPLAVDSDAESLRARLVLGFYAHAAEEPELARQYLQSAGAAAATLEDWRLYLLSDTLRAAGDLPAARAAVVELLEDHPDSPLRVRALELAADLERRQGDLAGAGHWLDQARAATADRDTLLRLEVIAWEVAESLGNADVQRRIARRLAVDFPVRAAELGAHRVFAEGGPDWTSVLSPDELARRADSLIEADLFGEALATLDGIPEARRDNDWWLLRVEVLTDDHRGVEALSVIEGLQPRDSVESAEIAWRRSLAALDASRSRRGRSNLLTSRREEMKLFALETLRWIIDNDLEPEISVKAHRILFTELARNDDATAEAIEALEALRRVDPGETRGNEFLWDLGWDAYSDRQLTEAIERWGELAEIYPESSRARWGKYWTARALEKLDRAADAQVLFREIVASDSTDFYRLHALNRLEGDEPPPLQRPATPQKVWPRDPGLDRARLLTDLGLGELALIELEALRETVDPRAFDAEEAMALAAAGRPRESIQAIRKAFPALGGARQSSVPREALELYYPLAYRDLVVRFAGERALDTDLVLGMIRQESAFDAEATSWAGARGLMQIIPSTGRETAQRLGLDFSTQKLVDPEFSIRLGTAYFRQVMDMFDDDVELALAGYNGGPYRLRRLWRQAGSGVEKDEFFEGLPVAESRTYVKRILLLSDSYRRLYGERAF